jgi:hypothetical protein
MRGDNNQRKSTMRSENRRAWQPIVILLGLEATTLAIMSVLHLSGTLAGGTRPFRPTDAGIAEAAICGVLLGGAAALAHHPLRGRAIALAAPIRRRSSSTGWSTTRPTCSTTSRSAGRTSSGSRWAAPTGYG